MAPPLGIIAGAEFPVSTLSLDAGSLYLFTDGVTEARGTDGELGVEGLEGMIVRCSGQTPEERLRGLVSEIRRIDSIQRDDITFLLLEDLRGD